MKTLLGAAIAGSMLASLAGGAASAANLVQNGDFETGNISGWTTNAAISYAWTATGSSPTDGSYAASTGCIGAACTDQTNLATAQYLYQDIATTAGHSYTLTFDFTPNGGTENELKALFGSSVVFDLVDAANTGSLVAYTVSGLSATGSTTRLEFLGRQDPGYDRLDDIVVQDNGITTVSSAPEPGAWVLMIGGVGAMGLMFRRRRSAALAA